MCDQRSGELEVQDHDVRSAENRLRITMGGLPADITVSSVWVYLKDPERSVIGESGVEGFPFNDSVTRAEEDDARFWSIVRAVLKTRGAVYITVHGTFIDGETPAVLWYGVMLCYGKLFGFTADNLRGLIAKPEPGAILRDWPDTGVGRSDAVLPEFRFTR